MADGDGTAVDVEAIVGNAKLVAAVDHLHGKSLVQFPQADVLDFLAGPLQQLGDGEHRPDAHFIGFAPGDGETAEDTHRLQSLLRGHAVAHEDLHRSPVRKLAGIAGGDHAAFDCGLDLRDALVLRVRANALVLARRGLFGRFLTGVLVDHFHGGRNRNDLVLELAFRPRLCRLQLAVHAVTVLDLAADLVALRHVLGGSQHGPVDFGLVLLQPGIREHVLVHLVLHAGDGLDAAGQENLRFAGQDALRRQRHGLQAG